MNEEPHLIEAGKTVIVTAVAGTCHVSIDGVETTLNAPDFQSFGPWGQDKTIAVLFETGAQFGVSY